MEEYETLLDTEKASSIRSKIKSIQYVKYGLELDILAENAVSNPNENQLQEWNNQLSDLVAKESALKVKLNDILKEI